MALLFKTHFKLARTSIKENRTRSFLTCLGIAIGVASIILILSLMGSISNLVKNEVNEIGSDLIVVRPNSTKNSINNIIEELTSSYPPENACANHPFFHRHLSYLEYQSYHVLHVAVISLKYPNTAET